MNLYVAAYSSSPAWEKWDSELEGQFLPKLYKSCAAARIIELPYCGSYHPHDDKWMLNNLSPEHNYIYTTIPGVMQRLQHDSQFGLASCDEGGRLRAIEFVKGLFECVTNFSSRFDGAQIFAVELHSAPNRSKSEASYKAFTQSLREICSWNWGGVKILIEHCDAYFSDNPSPSKGFLSLDDEIKAVETINRECIRKVGFVLNWARSAIEARDVNNVYAHISTLSNLGLLTGFCFSGVSSVDGAYGQWEDRHMPSSTSDKFPFGADGSLLDASAVAKTVSMLSATESLEYIGVKVAAIDGALIDDRCQLNRNVIDMIAEFSTE